LNFYCVDAARNNATATTSFTVSIDDSGPQITRIYKSGGGLNVFTNEYSECRYGFNNNFDYDNSSSMGSGIEHSAAWEPVNYYVQCKDVYKNPGSIFRIRGYDLK